MDDRTSNLVKECQRQFDNCLYTSAALFIWEKRARLWRGLFLVAPIILGGFAGSQLIVQSGTTGKLLGALCGVVAGFCPAIFKALNLDLHVDGIHRGATEFGNLRDRFRRAASVTAFASFEEFSAEFEALMDRMDAARTAAPPAPEWCFKDAQKKISRGDYTFDVDGVTPVSATKTDAPAV